jgi:hypothetical protein
MHTLLGLWLRHKVCCAALNGLSTTPPCRNRRFALLHDVPMLVSCSRWGWPCWCCPLTSKAVCPGHLYLDLERVQQANIVDAGAAREVRAVDLVVLLQRRLHTIVPQPPRGSCTQRQDGVQYACLLYEFVEHTTMAWRRCTCASTAPSTLRIRAAPVQLAASARHMHHGCTGCNCQQCVLNCSLQA